MEKLAEEKLKKEMPFHLYGRFAPIRDIIEKNRKAEETLRILDVGGRGNWTRKFFPNDDVFYLEPNIDSSDKNFIKGDGCAIPLKDRTFDWVVSTDVFEHIPNEKRKLFLNENLRVAKLGVILVAPFYSPEVAQAEIYANEKYKILSGGKDHIWLKEHIENGLPKINDFEKVLGENKLIFQKLYNNRLFLWQMLIGVEFLVDVNQYENLSKDIEDLNYFYNTEVYPFDNKDPSYRKIYFIKKDKILKNIEIKNKVIDDKLFLKVIEKVLAIINKIATDGMNNLKQLMQKKDQEINFMKSSKFWKLREKYINLKNKF